MNIVFFGINIIVAIIVTCMLMMITDTTRNHDPRYFFKYIIELTGVMFIIILWLLFDTTYILSIIR